MEGEARRSSRIAGCRASRRRGGSNPTVGEGTSMRHGHPGLDRVVEETTVSPVFTTDLISETERGQERVASSEPPTEILHVHATVDVVTLAAAIAERAAKAVMDRREVLTPVIVDREPEIM